MSNSNLVDPLQFPLPLAYSVGILCVHMVFNCLRRCRAPCCNSMAFFHSLIQPQIADESNMHDNTQITPGSSDDVITNKEIEKVDLHLEEEGGGGGASAGDDALMLSREEVEMVLGNLGLIVRSSDCDDDDQLKESFGPVELSVLFEEVEPSLDELKETFRVFDANRDGFIDAEDLHGILCKLGLREKGYSAVNDCERMIRAVSKKGHDRMDLKEFMNFMENSLC